MCLSFSGYFAVLILTELQSANSFVLNFAAFNIALDGSNINDINGNSNLEYFPPIPTSGMDLSVQIQLWYHLDIITLEELQEVFEQGPSDGCEHQNER